jgi:hypothetical protein
MVRPSLAIVSRAFVYLYQAGLVELPELQRNDAPRARG